MVLSVEEECLVSILGSFTVFSSKEHDLMNIYLSHPSAPHIKKACKVILAGLIDRKRLPISSQDVHSQDLKHLGIEDIDGAPAHSIFEEASGQVLASPSLEQVWHIVPGVLFKVVPLHFIHRSCELTP